MKEVHRDLEKCEIKAEEIANRHIFRKKVAEVKDIFEEKTRKNRILAAEERARVSQRMKEYLR